MKDVNGSTPLHSAALNNQGCFISELLRLFPDTNINAQDSDGLTPLHIAATHGSKDSIELIVKADPSSLHLKDKRGRLPLHLAALHGHSHCLERLITPKSIEHRDLNGSSALWIACIFGHQNVVEYLVRMGADANKVDDRFGEPPILVALLEKHVSIVEHLLDHGAHTNIVSKRGITLVQAAVLAGDQTLLQRLLELEYGNPKCKKSATPTDPLSSSRALESVLTSDSLTTRSLDISSDTSSMVTKPSSQLGIALQTLDWQSFYDLDSSHSANGQLYDNVYCAAINGLGSLLEPLRRYNFFLTGTSLRNFDPLTEAARRGFPGFIAAARLLGMGLRPQSGFLALRMQQDALLVASIHRNVQTAKELLMSGADPTLKDCFGLRALDYATQNRALLEAFREHTSGQAPLDASSVSNAIRKSIVDFAGAVKSLQISGKENQSQVCLELSALAAGLQLLHSSSSIEQARICRMALRHESGDAEFLCDICSHRVPTLSYQCTICADVDLCPSCYSGYCASTPHTIPEFFFSLKTLDAKVEPVFGVMEMFLTRHIELLPECLGLLGPLAERWIDVRLAEYADWESSAMSNKGSLQKTSAWELLCFLDKTRRYDWIHTGKGEEQPVQNMDYTAYMRRKIRSIFVSFNPRMEPHILECDGHQYLCLVPFKDLSPTDRACFSSEGVLHTTFLQNLIEEYTTPPSCEEKASISARFSDMEAWPCRQEPGDPHDDTIETATATEDTWSMKLKVLEFTRRTIMSDVVSGFKPKTTEQTGQGCRDYGDITISHEISWRLAHAMLGMPFTNTLAELLHTCGVGFTEQVEDREFVSSLTTSDAIAGILRISQLNL
ncbi:ankyrin-1 [Colletotrichum filicis]|nr:ankyrin-1 [Colletotrichum filicis]